MKKKMNIDESNLVNATLSWLDFNNVGPCDSFKELVAKVESMDELRTRISFSIGETFVDRNDILLVMSDPPATRSESHYRGTGVAMEKP